jgi:beta-glucosidase
MNDATTSTAQMASAFAGSTAVEVRLGSPTGRLLAIYDVPRVTYQTVSAHLAPADGMGNVYLVFGGQAGIATFFMK